MSSKNKEKKKKNKPADSPFDSLQMQALRVSAAEDGDGSGFEQVSDAGHSDPPPYVNSA